ncbi:hypothetical protein Tco_1017840 [Tanacetum coccineum]|uniref:Uncharacterized protein n=1 Tax=Tanacetum coccineum TaxID=301880 RepID=A0ABQ5FU13_9ASTR
MEIFPNEEEVTIDVIPLAVKSPSIVDWKIHKEGRKSYYQIIRDDGKSQMYMIFSRMLISFDREDLETLYKLVKAKYESTRPVEDLDLVLWNDLKTIFEPHVEDNIWRNQQDYKVLSWKLFEPHFLRTQHMQIYMWVENKYPLTPSTLSMKLEKKLMIDYETEVSAAHELERKYAKCLLFVFSTWMAFGGNTRDLGSFGEETDKITVLHQIHEKVLFTERGDGVAGIKRCCRDLSSDGVRDLATASGRGQLKEDLESST